MIYSLSGHVLAERRQGILQKIAILVTLLLGLIPGAAGQDLTNAPAGANPSDLSLEELINLRVTSVGKKETSLLDSPAAVTVISQEDFQRLGFTSIPDALRLVPGFNVARVDPTQWAISSRGFNSIFANKLLVLMDGRSIYSPSFGGVFWDAQDTDLEDLDRIEAIRGPGATLWGANAVNGVINIVSKNSKDTQGLLVTTSGGTEDQPSTTVRYGGELSPDWHYRTYVKYFNRDGFVDTQGKDANQDWDSIRSGFRSDWAPSTENLVTVQGDYYGVNAAQHYAAPQLTPPFVNNIDMTRHNQGGNLLGRWTHDFSDDSHLSLQAYYDYLHEVILVSPLDQTTGDIQLEHRFPIAGFNDVIWGLDYRIVADRSAQTTVASFQPDNRNMNLYTAFLQDDLTIVPDRFHFILGSKIEKNEYTGFEVEPGVRLLWTPTEHQSVWAAVSRAVSPPSRMTHDARLNLAAFQTSPTNPVMEMAYVGNGNLESESLWANEIGYRLIPSSTWSLEATAFYNIYDHLVGATTLPPQFEIDPAPPHLLLPLQWQNNMRARTYGTELSATWNPLDYWKLMASYSFLEMHVQPDGGTAAGSPEQQAGLRSYLTLPGNLELNNAVYYVDQINPSYSGPPAVHVPAYVRLDAGVVWHATHNLEVGFWAQNLIDDRHLEMPNVSSSTEIPRTFLGKVTVRF